MDIPWDDLQLFLAVAETGSVSGAARRLKVGQPTVSRRLAALEYRLGHALFRRSVGGAALTGEGERLLAPARKMAEWAGEAARAAESKSAGPTGLVRVTAPPLVCADFLAPFAGWLRTTHPGLRLEVSSAMQLLDLARGESELALRAAPPTQPELKVVAGFEFRNAAYVSKSLAKTLPKKPKFGDLPWIAWSPPWDALPPNPQLERLVPGFVPSFTADNILVHVAAAEAGVGAIVMPCVHHRFRRPTNLVAVNVDLGPYQCGPMYLVCAKSALDIPRIRKVAELLEAELGKVEGAKRLAV